MKVIQSHTDLDKLRPPPDVAGVVRKELDTLLELSGGKTIDPAHGRVVLFEEGDSDTELQAVMDRPFERLLFEGVVFRGQCWVGFVAHNNQCLTALILPDALIPAEWRTLLIREIAEGGI